MTLPTAVLGPPCWFCSAPRPSQAAFCPQCGRAALVGCAAVMRMGKSYVLGRHTDGGFAVWDHTNPEPEARYAPNDWARANHELDIVENPPPPPPPSLNRPQVVMAPRSYGGVITLMVLLPLVAGLYLWLHAHRYSGCLIAPGIFDWPSACF